MTTADKVMRIGIVVTVIGLVCTLVAITPLLVPSVHLASWWWGMSMITAVGLLIVLSSFWVAGRSRSASIHR